MKYNYSFVLIAVFLSLFILTGCSANESNKNINEAIIFADENLKLAIRNELNINTNDVITKSDIEKLRVLEATMKNIINLSGLEYAENLEVLNLTWNSIKDIHVLADLKLLRELNLSANEITDIKSLSELTNLNNLDLSANDIRNIESIEELTELTKLNLSGNDIQDISYLSALTNLEELYLINIGLGSISPLDELYKLENVSLGGNYTREILEEKANTLSASVNGNRIYLNSVITLEDIYLFNIVPLSWSPDDKYFLFKVQDDFPRTIDFHVLNVDPEQREEILFSFIELFPEIRLQEFRESIGPRPLYKEHTWSEDGLYLTIILDDAEVENKNLEYRLNLKQK